MAYISTDELKTHLYAENIDVIARSDDTIIQAAIEAAVVEAKGYLTAFDIKAEFEKVKSDPDTRNALLLIFIKDIAVWHFVNLCNAGTDLQLRQDRYERAIDWLKSVQKGNVTPDLPALPDDTKTGLILFSSNQKRNNHF
jgi:phage gp36-like protein